MEGFAVDGGAARPSFADGGDSGGGGGVEHVQGRAGDFFGQADDAAEGDVLGQSVVDLGHVFEAGAAFPDQLAIHVHDDVVVFRVDDAQTLVCGQDLEDFPDVAKIHHAGLAVGRDVGGEDFHRGVAGLDGFSDLWGQVDGQSAFHHQVR